MTKNQFLEALRFHLHPLPEEGRLEVLHYYAQYFDLAKANGRAEEETARELGDPRRLAADALGIPYDPYPDPQPAEPPVSFGTGPVPSAGGSAARMLAMTFPLLFLNLIVLPIGVSLWAAIASFGAAALGAIFAPAAFVLDWLANGDYYPAKLFVSIAMTGFGMLLALAVKGLIAAGWRATAAYGRWTLHVWKGGN